jgi:uncharacterized membrane protein YGL010W
MLAGRPWSEWVERYAQSHQHPTNQLCHLIGIPLIVISLVLVLLAFWLPGLWSTAVVLFAGGWAFQFGGHAVEGTAPEFLHDPRFLLVGVRWWLAKLTSR